MFLRTRIHPTNEQNGNLYLSCLFYGLVHMMFNGFSELPLLISRLPVFYKQRDNYFHAAWAWNISSWILRVPYSLLEAVVWSCVVYYTVGFAPGAGRYLLFTLVDDVFSDCIFRTSYIPQMFQVFPFYAFTLFNTPNGIGSFPFDGLYRTRYGSC